MSAHLAGIASGVNNAVARTGSLVAVAAIPVVAGFAAGEAVDDATLLDGYGKVVWVSAGFAVAAALVSAIWIRRIGPEAPPAAPPPFHCAATGPPVAVTRGVTARAATLARCASASNLRGQSSDYTFRHRIRVRFAETDAMGIVHHSRYLLYLEEARVAYLRHIGRPYPAWRAAGMDATVLEVHVGYLKPLRFDDEFDVHVALAEVGRTTFQMAYLVQRDVDVSATGVTAHGLINPAGRPMRLPAWLADLCEAAPDRS